MDKYYSYTEKFKLSIVSFADKKGNYAVIQEYSVKVISLDTDRTKENM
jgi:hypothetical protein